MRRGHPSTVALLLLVFALPGCGGPNRAAQEEQLERIIRAELPDSLPNRFEDDGHGEHTLSDVRCTHDEGDRFNCTATASRSWEEDVPSPSASEDGFVQSGSFVSEAALIAIIGNCIDEHCSWRVED